MLSSEDNLTLHRVNSLVQFLLKYAYSDGTLMNEIRNLQQILYSNFDVNPDNLFDAIRLQRESSSIENLEKVLQEWNHCISVVANASTLFKNNLDDDRGKLDQFLLLGQDVAKQYKEFLPCDYCGRLST